MNNGPESDMKLTLLTKTSFFVEEDKILTSLFEEGLDSLHLYKPQSEPIYSERLLTLISDSYYKYISVHDHFYLKEEFGLRGIHLSRPEVKAPYGYRGSLSRTCHSIAELKAAKKGASYVFLKTIFDSQTNPNDKQTITYDELVQAQRDGLIDKKVYAMGGMKLDNIRLARELGFGGVVICGDLWNRFNIHSQQDFRSLIAHFVQLRKAVD